MQDCPVSDVRGVWLHGKAALRVEGQYREAESQMEEERGESDEGGERRVRWRRRERLKRKWRDGGREVWPTENRSLVFFLYLLRWL